MIWFYLFLGSVFYFSVAFTFLVKLLSMNDNDEPGKVAYTLAALFWPITLLMLLFGFYDR